MNFVTDIYKFCWSEVLG